MLTEFRRVSKQVVDIPVGDTVSLTMREQEVLGLVAKGATNKEIATSLNVSIHTVKSHIRNILAKFQVSSNT